MVISGWHAQCAVRFLSASVSIEKGRVILITGPTAVGKSAAAISLARRLNGEIISADSIQIYKGLDVGSAKVPHRDRQNVPHHLLDMVYPTEDYTAENFCVDAKAAVDLTLARGRVPIIVGGSGLYIRWFLNGKLGSPKATEDQAATINAVVSRLHRAAGGWDDAVEYLAKAGDVDGASRLARNDWDGLRRALEVIEITYRPQSAFPSNHYCQLDYDCQCYFMYMDRLDLYRRIDQRCEEMLTDLSGQGLMKEAMWLLDLGVVPNSNPASKAIGYRQAMEYLLACRKSKSATSVSQFMYFLQEFQQASRTYAERQLTWYQGEEVFKWLDGSSPNNVVDTIEQDYNRKSSRTALEMQGCFFESQRRMSRKLRALKTYAARNTIFTKPSACTNILHWIEKTQSSVNVFV